MLLINGSLTDFEVTVCGLDIGCQTSARSIKVDIGYGGAFYAIAVDHDLGVDVNSSSTADIVRVATLVSGE